MPFTPAHIAAVLPLRKRWNLVWPALLAGSIAPDFEYFITVGPSSRILHRFPEVFTYALPVALVLLWLWYTFFRPTVNEVLPEAVRSRLLPPPKIWSGGFKNIALLLISIVIGLLTHVVWDDFTHADSPVSRHFHWMMQLVRVPVIGARFRYGLFQWISSAVGMAIVAVFMVVWYRRSPRRGVTRVFSRWQKSLLVGVPAAIAAAWAVYRTYHMMGDHFLMNRHLFVLTCIAATVFFCWEILAISIFIQGRRQWRSRKAAECAQEQVSQSL